VLKQLPFATLGIISHPPLHLLDGGAGLGSFLEGSTTGGVGVGGGVGRGGVGRGGVGGGKFLLPRFILPVKGFNPKTVNNIKVIIDISINGTNTKTQDIIPKPLEHKELSNRVNTIIIQNLKNAALYMPLKVSIIICVNEKHKYINAGEHNVFTIAIYIILGKNSNTFFKISYLVAYILIF